MRKINWNFNVDWKSKLLDLLIVIIGITIAFQLNNWNDSRKIHNEEKAYRVSFYEESKINQENLAAALEFSISAKKDVGTLKTILLNKNYSDERIKPLIASLMAMASFNPITTTMENITASGEFDLITDIELRKNIIATYNGFKNSTKLESLLQEYVNTYLTPFLLHNIQFSDFTSINSDYVKDPMFENIVLGYEALLSQQINGYKTNLDKLNQFNNRLKGGMQ